MLQRSQDRISLPVAIAGCRPKAYAAISGSPEYPELRGTVRFYQMNSGVVVAVDVIGLPIGTDSCPNGIHGFHIHEGNSCSGTADMPFSYVGGHYNPQECPHPAHAGDLPPLIVTRHGRAWSAFLTDRFTLEEIIGRTVIIHSARDDFTSQPSGNAGYMIACGVIQRNR